MSFNNRIIKGLVLFVLFCFVILIINYLFCNNNRLIESFVISFISGAFVSLFIAYIQYDKERRDIIIHYNNEIISYYILLKHIITSLHKSGKSCTEKIDEAKRKFDNYVENNRYRNISLELNLILNNINNKYRKKIYTVLYEYTNGIELMDYFEKKKKTMKELERICKKQQVDIMEGISILSQILDVEYNWDKIEKNIYYHFYGKD